MAEPAKPKIMIEYDEYDKLVEDFAIEAGCNTKSTETIRGTLGDLIEDALVDAWMNDFQTSSNLNEPKPFMPSATAYDADTHILLGDLPVAKVISELKTTMAKHSVYVVKVQQYISQFISWLSNEGTKLTKLADMDLTLEDIEGALENYSDDLDKEVEAAKEAWEKVIKHERTKQLQTLATLIIDGGKFDRLDDKILIFYLLPLRVGGKSNKVSKEATDDDIRQQTMLLEQQAEGNRGTFSILEWEIKRFLEKRRAAQQGISGSSPAKRTKGLKLCF